MTKQFIRVYRNAAGEVSHVMEQDTPINYHIRERDTRTNTPIQMTFEDWDFDRHPMVQKMRARALLEVFRTAETEHAIINRVRGIGRRRTDPRPVPAGRE